MDPGHADTSMDDDASNDADALDGLGLGRHLTCDNSDDSDDSERTPTTWAKF